MSTHYLENVRAHPTFYAFYFIFTVLLSLLVKRKLFYSVPCALLIVGAFVEIPLSAATDICSPWLYNFETGKCYRKFCKGRSQMDAEKHCQSLGGHLATACNEQQNNFLAVMGYAYYPPGTPGFRTWIGLHWKGRSTWDWVWETGSTCPYRKWAKGWKTPDNWHGTGNPEQCVHLWSTQYRHMWDTWNDLDCALNEHFICETDDCTQL